jgi:hypothetical protein
MRRTPDRGLEATPLRLAHRAAQTAVVLLSLMLSQVGKSYSRNAVDI